MNKMDYEYISSRQNEKVKYFASLKNSKYRAEHSLFLAEGVKLTDEATRSGAAKYILINEDSLSDDAVKRTLDKSGDDVIKYILAAPAFEKITSENAPQGIIAVCAFPQRYYDRAPSPDEVRGRRVIAFDEVRDPGNLGAVLRSAAAFGYDAVILGSCADVFGQRCVRASMGAVFSLSIYCVDSLAPCLGKLSAERRIIGAALYGEPEDFTTMKKTSSDVPVIGNEGHGISDETASCCTSFCKIPITEKAESLNAGVAASVIMWEYSKISRE